MVKYSLKSSFQIHFCYLEKRGSVGRVGGATNQAENYFQIALHNIPRRRSAFAGHVTPNDYAIGDVNVRGFVRCDVAPEALATASHQQHHSLRPAYLDNLTRLRTTFLPPENTVLAA